MAIGHNSWLIIYDWLIFCAYIFLHQIEMDIAQRDADRRAFREFLRQLRYEPQVSR